jgi:hypothetical protein
MHRNKFTQAVARSIFAPPVTFGSHASHPLMFRSSDSGTLPARIGLKVIVTKSDFHQPFVEWHTGTHTAGMRFKHCPLRDRFAMKSNRPGAQTQADDLYCHGYFYDNYCNCKCFYYHYCNFFYQRAVSEAT